jgi:hypothetical protein
MSPCEYDLTRRAKVGSSRRYNCEEVFSVLDDAGRPAQRQRRVAKLAEEILADSSSGAPRERWKFTAFTCDIERNYAKDAYGLRESVQQYWEVGLNDVLPPSGAIVVESATEKADVFYPDTDSFGLAKTSPSAFITAELVLHSRQFSMLATHAHGGIGQLRRVGDTAKMTFSGRTDRARNGEMFEAMIVRSENIISFEAVTTRHALDVALLTYNAPYEVICPGWGPTHCEQIGRIWIDLATGWPVAGEHYQTNYMGGVPVLPDGTHVPIKVRFETSIALIAD